MTVLAAQAIVLPFLGAVLGLLVGPRLTRVLAGGLRQDAETPVVAEGSEAHVSAEAEGEAAPPEAQAGPPGAVTGGARGALGPVLCAVLPTAAMTVLTAVIATVQWQSPATRAGVLTTIPTGTAPITVGLTVDGLAALLGLLVGCVALAVQVYSVAYMRDEPRYSSYAAFVSLFTSAMLLVVFARDLLLLYVGWEIMGVCSYFLIGHHWEDRANTRAAIKAFLVTRVGDAGFLLGIIVLGVGAGGFDIPTVLANAESLPHTTVVVAALLLLCGVAGKSAQFPLHTWLPDAMAGPTPISALIHAATMVAAGIYLVARLYPVFLAAPVSLAVLGVLAAISMVGAALAALAQDDLKRVLAYSTISQLAYMAAGLAVGAKTAAMFHLVTHGAFKALLFLSAGCVIHAVGSNLLAGMGGLRRAMPVTFVCMTIGYAALAGLPPFSGFFSKDAIVEGAQELAFNGAMDGAPDLPGWVAWSVYLAMLATIFLTAAYAMRAWLLTFFGTPAEGAHEAPALMRWPLVLLAVPAAFVGFCGLGADELRPHAGTAAMSLLFVAAGAAVTYLTWKDAPSSDPAARLRGLRPVFANAFYVDSLYDRVIVRPVLWLAGAVRGFDVKVVDGAVEGVVPATRRLGALARLPQGGNPQTYLTGVLAGAVFLVLAVVVFS
ncbi:NADH-quinone oxidoreductase subunit L [Actinocorallia longicatena]|uniref:NADH-quinone oxidoreductase subunit L n=1 Tax=Actinocorallia longicatena TaxID=111803 RepID=A0ABP6QM01_9ACTN